METSELFPTESQPTSSRLASHVSRTHAPGSEWATRMTELSGLSLARSLRECGPIGSLLKTLLASSAWRSTACYLTWKRKVTKQGRSYFQLAPSTRRTGEIVSGLLPTISAQEPGWRHIEIEDKNGNQPEHWNQRFYDKKTGRMVQKGLTQIARMFPTPTARDWKDGTAKSCENVPTNGLLGRAVHMLPTTTESEGSLNAALVEIVMGYPQNWTDLTAADPNTGTETGSAESRESQKACPTVQTD